ncbi:uncharacterized protein LOC117642719 [Thrips palmi]|uniref:Uncharacterized protein LOC117642719 n=1 Tax=Thrips palmi TaxID=161013 RepID=A0A6P8YBS1_THRPL|nr:uncharacterized protein LOC117642719 [Thrips palmi]
MAQMDAANRFNPLVIFDLETTGLNIEDEVIQIAAVVNPGSAFNCFMMPARDIPGEVTALRGFAKHGDSLTLDGRRVDTVTRSAAVRGFLEFVRQARGTTGTEHRRMVLASHYAFGFGADRLLRLVDEEGQVAALAELVEGFADTLPVFRTALPHRAHGTYKLGMLAQDLEVMDGVGALHSADRDAIVMKRLIDTLGVAEQLKASCRPLSEFKAFRTAELRYKLRAIKALEEAAKQVKTKLPEVVESAGWASHFHLGQLDEQQSNLESAKEEWQDFCAADAESQDSAREEADLALTAAQHLPDWLALADSQAATWTLELRQGGVVWRGSFPVAMFAEAACPALYSLLDDGVLQRQTPRQQCGTVVKRLRRLEATVRKVKAPLERLFHRLEFFRNKREEDHLEAIAHRLSDTRQKVEDALNAPGFPSLGDTMKLVDETLQRDQYLADWLQLIADGGAVVDMKVQLGSDAWAGKTSMKEFPQAAQVLLFDVMCYHKVERQ